MCRWFDSAPGHQTRKPLIRNRFRGFLNSGMSLVWFGTPSSHTARWSCYFGQFDRFFRCDSRSKGLGASCSGTVPSWLALIRLRTWWLSIVILGNCHASHNLRLPQVRPLATKAALKCPRSARPWDTAKLALAAL